MASREDHIIVCASGETLDARDVEAIYARSSCVQEICVIALAEPDDAAAVRLHAVVVPDFTVLRSRRIVNVGDLIRFEMEGQSIDLPLHARVQSYDIWFEPLPRTDTGAPHRGDIERRVAVMHADRRRAREAAAAQLVATGDPHVDRALDLIRARVAPGVPVALDSNLELDLGLDSTDRVALVADLERGLGCPLAPEPALDLFTVRALIDALRPAAGAAAAEAETENAWRVLLRNLPSPDDGALAGLRSRRSLAAPVLFIVSRLLRLALPRIVVTGLEHLPDRGPYIITPNHQCFLDAFLVCGVLPYRAFAALFFVGAAEYFETPFMRWVARQCNCVPVDPDAHLVPAMRAGAFGLVQGKILMLFPEGERSIDGTIKHFKKGAPILARHLEVPIVPVAIRGAFEIWPRNRPFNWKALVPGSGHRVRIAFGPPMRVDETLDDAEAARRLRDEVERLWQSPGRGV